jgi:hypothetical protein
MRTTPTRVFTLGLIACIAISVIAPAVAVADDGRAALKHAYIVGSRHSPIAIGGDLLSGEEDNLLRANDPDEDGGTFSSSSTPNSPQAVADLRNVQVNDPALDNIQTFPTITPPTRPFEKSVQSETSIARSGRTIVVGYNTSANQPVVQVGNALFFTHRFLSGFSTSHDGGKTWTSGFIQPNAGSPFTFGDPSVGVDRAGNFYYAGLGTDAGTTLPDGRVVFQSTIIVGKSTDGGDSFAPAKIVAIDNGSDKEWLAVGRDPANRSRDNLYVAWTSFQFNAAGTATTGSQLRFSRSTDGGATWSAQRTLFAPTDGGLTGLSSFIQFANPVVDPSSGRLYIPFLHFSNFDADFVKVLVSDDGGATFRFLEFNVAGAPDRFGFPNVTPGEIADCGSPGGGFRNVLHQGANLGGGRFGLARYRQATRLITQPSAAAANGRLFIALNTSTSSVFGDPAAGSSIRLLSSLDGGATFSTTTVVRSTGADPQHVHPAVTTDEDASNLQIAYYVQQANGKLRIDAATGKVAGNNVKIDKGTMPVSSAAFDLPPSNNPILIVTTPPTPFRTTNYDRTIVACYAIGEYLGITGSDDDAMVAWGDMRNSWTSPAGSPAVGTHSQPDVFFQKLDE